MRKSIFIILIIMSALFGCGKKGPIELPTSESYINDNLQPPMEMDLTVTRSYTHVIRFDPVLNQEGWVGRAQGTEIRLLYNAPAEVADDPDAVYTLRLHLLYKMGLSSLNVTIAPLTTDWDSSSVTWEEASEDTPWTTPGGDYDPAHAVAATVSEAEDSLLSIDITPLYDYWAENENHGFIIIANDFLLTDPEHLAFSTPYNNDDETDEKPAIVITSGETTTTELITSSDHISDLSARPEYINDPTLFTLGDGYVPVLALDYSPLDYKWEILEATLSFTADPVLMKYYFGLDITVPEEAEEKIYCYTVENEDPTDFTFDKYGSTVPGYDEATSRFTLDITGSLRHAFENNQPIGLLPPHYRNQLREMAITDAAVHIVYRRNIEEYEEDFEVTE